MRTKEECAWCMSTPDIERKYAGMPEEFKFRCSACHELWSEIHYECDTCGVLINSEEEPVHYHNHGYFCEKCKPSP